MKIGPISINIGSMGYLVFPPVSVNVHGDAFKQSTQVRSKCARNAPMCKGSSSVRYHHRQTKIQNKGKGKLPN